MDGEFTSYRFILTTAEIEESLFYGESSPVPNQERVEVRLVFPAAEQASPEATPRETQPSESEQNA